MISSFLHQIISLLPSIFVFLLSRAPNFRKEIFIISYYLSLSLSISLYLSLSLPLSLSLSRFFTWFAGFRIRHPIFFWKIVFFRLEKKSFFFISIFYCCLRNCLFSDNSSLIVFFCVNRLPLVLSLLFVLCLFCLWGGSRSNKPCRRIFPDLCHFDCRTFLWFFARICRHLFPVLVLSSLFLPLLCSWYH